MNATDDMHDIIRQKQPWQYLDEIYSTLESGTEGKEVACSITTDFRLVPSMRAAPGLNPYHASIADCGYGFDAVQGTIERLRQGNRFRWSKNCLYLTLIR